MLQLPWMIVGVVLGTAAPNEPKPPTIDPVADREPAASQPVTTAGWDVTTPPASGQQVVGEFLKAVEANEAYDAKARAFVVSARPKSGEPIAADYLHNALAVLSAEFKKAVELAASGESAAAADAFERLSRSDDPYLAVASASLASAALVELDQLDRCREMLARVWQTHRPIDRFTLSADSFQFTLGYCLVQGLEYEAAEATLKNFVERFPNAPERLRVTASQMLTELGRRIPGRLGDVRDLLAFAERRIRLGRTDEPVRQRQHEAVDLLSRLIEEAEDREKSQGGGESGGGGKSGRNSDSKAGGQRPGSGATQSTLPGGESRAGELRKTRVRPGDAWGKMPPRQRDEILQTLQQQFPSQYRELLEQYYKQLAKDAAIQR